MTPGSTATDPAHVAAQLEQTAHALRADFVLIGLLEHDALVFPYHCGTLPPELSPFLHRGRVRVNEHPLAATLVETGSAAYGEDDFHAEGTRPLQHRGLREAVHPLKTPEGTVIGLIHLGRAHMLGPWTETERTLLHHGAADLARIFRDHRDRIRVHPALRDGPHFLEAVLSAVPNVIYVYDFHTQQANYVNDRLTALLGHTLEDLQAHGEHFHAQLIHPQDLRKLGPWREQTRSLADGETLEIEYRLRHQDGSWRWILGRERVFTRGEDGAVSQLIGTLEDVTARRHNEERLRLFENVVLSTRDAVLITEAEPIDPPGPRIVYANGAFTDMTGYPLEEVLGQTPRLLQGPKTDRAQLDKIRTALRNWQPVRVELVNYRKDGSEFEVELEVTPIADEAGWFTHWVSVQRDITDRKRREAHLAFTASLHHAVAPLRDAEAILRTVGQRVADHLGLVHCLFVEIDEAAAQATVLYDHHHPDALDLRGEYPLFDFHTPAQRQGLQRGTVLTIHDVRDGPSDAAAGFEALGIRALVTAPYVSDGGRWTFALSGQLNQPHAWREDEIAVLTEVARWLYPKLERVRAEEALQDADRRKDEFLATLAHELRNPLAPIRMGIEIVKRSPDRTVREEAMSVIERQTEQIVRLVDDLLDVSRITQGTIPLVKAPITLDQVVTMALEAAHPLMAQKNHQLLLGLPARKVWLEGDGARLSQVFLNLLTNATKYSPVGSEISVNAELTGEEVVVRVRDTGIGLAPESLERVFDLFARVNSGEAAQQDGLGIGLNLVQRLVQLHGGSIAVSSPGLGQGSTFAVRLPVLSEHEPVAGVAQPDAGAAAPRRVLVVDDYEANRKTLTRMLRLMGHEVTAAIDGPAALELLAAFAPDLVLLDINMPGMSGYDVVRRIRENVAHRDLQVVALTGYGAHDDVRQASEAGFDRHLVKPVSMALLEQVLRNRSG